MNKWHLISGFSTVALSSAVVVQPAFAQGTAITGVQLQQTDRGLELILESSTGKQPETFRTTYGETLIIDLINTQLQLPEGEQISQQNPAPGIASVEVVQQYSNTVRVKLVGTEEVPTAQVNTTVQGVAFNVSTGMKTAEEPAPTPEEEPAPTPQQPEAGQQEPIELVVTATRTEERQEDVARSVTVIDREEIEQQTTLTQDIGDILGELVPGFGPPTFTDRGNVQTLRGRTPQILIDGVPLNINSRIPIQTRFIAPSSIERIEVVRGPAAIFGGEAKGGVINIITREPTEQQFKASTKVGLGAALGGLQGESFSNRQEQTLAFNQGDFDFTFTFSRNDNNSFFDAEGDRIIQDNDTLNNRDTLNFLGKLGVDLSEKQRLQLTANYTRDQRNLESVVETTPDKAIGVEQDFDFEDDTTPKISNTLFNLNYTHEDLLGSEIQAQLFYREEFQRSLPFDVRPGAIGGQFGVFNNEFESEVWGARLQADTSFGNNVDLTLGADYEAQDDVGELVFNELSGSAFDQGTIRNTGETISDPAFELDKLGIFAQLQWDVAEWLSLSGGIRNEQFDFRADDFTSRGGDFVEGGEIDFDGTVFNAGIVADLSEQVNVFAKFSQGFSAPTLALFGFPNFVGLNPEGGFAIEEDIEDLQPQKIDEYELGIRGNWESVSATLSAFYNFSELGVTFESTEDITTISELIRSPKRIYGIEGTLDWELTDHWQLGGTLSWNEGDIDPNDDGDFRPISSFDIQPLKVTAYVENQTTPGWNNRLQLLVVGSRDRAFEEDVDGAPIESYAVLDYISSIKLGSGTLEIGIENLLDNQFSPVSAQFAGGNRDSRLFAAPGRRLTINYSLTW